MLENGPEPEFALETPDAKPAKKKAVKVSNPELPSSKYSARELWRLVNYYSTKVRLVPQAETGWMIKNIKRMIDAAIGFDQIAQALENYANDEWVKAQDPRNRKSARAFFTKESIMEWQTPRPPLRKPQPVQLNFETDKKPLPFVPRAEEEADDEL